MSRYLFIVLLTGASVAVAEPGFFADPLWDDGKAEVNLYQGVEPRYGIPRELQEAAMVVVKEDLRSDMLVKADDPDRTDLAVIKLNWSTVIPTGIYTYYQMATVWVARDSALPVRERFSSHEWCGATYQNLSRRNPKRADGRFVYQWDSYFAREGAGEKAINVDSPHPVVLADALPLYLRTLDLTGMSESGATTTLTTVITLRSNNARPKGLPTADVTVSVGEPETVTVPAGEFEAYPVRVEVPDEGADVYLIETGPMHRLVRMQLANGTRYDLRKSMRAAYWRMNGPGNREHRDGRGAEPASGATRP